MEFDPDLIRQNTSEGEEYWSARDLAEMLGYNRFDIFKKVIQKAEVSCINGNYSLNEHFSRRRIIAKIKIKGVRRKPEDVILSRFGVYLTVQNANPNKKMVALGKAYFAERTYRQELVEQWPPLPESHRWISMAFMDNFTSKTITTSSPFEWLDPKVFAKFQDYGYQGLYGGLKAGDIRQRKNLAENQEIPEHMNRAELACYDFMLTQTEAKIRKERITDMAVANQMHNEVGQIVRQCIINIGGALPEEPAVDNNPLKMN